MSERRAECRLEPVDVGPTASPGLLEAYRRLQRDNDLRSYLHHDDTPRVLILTTQMETYSLDEAHMLHLGIRRWRAMSVGTRGSLQKRLEDQYRIGRQRGPGERSPVPLPDWYDLTHVVYVHGPELGFDPMRRAYQLFVPPSEEYINFAEALHVRQPC